MTHVPSHDLDAEMSVLSAMMLTGRAIDDVREHVTREDFFRGTHGTIFTAMLDMHDRQVPVDAITLTNELERLAVLEQVGGRGKVHELAAWVSAAGNAAHYAKIIRDHATLRRLYEAGTTIRALGQGQVAGTPEDLLAQAEQALSGARGLLQSKEASPLTEGLDELFAVMRRVILTGVPEVGHSTGFPTLDDVLLGLWDEQLIIIAARTGEGKSTLALNIAENFVDRGDPVLFVTLEMSKRELQIRSLARESKVDSRFFLSGQLGNNPGLMEKVKAGKERVEKRDKLLVEASGSQTIEGIRSLALRYQRQHAIKALFVDYLQLITPPKAERHSLAIGEISRGLKMLAMQLAIPVVAVCQLNRDGAKSRPELYHLKESGSLEQDADVVIFLHDPKADDDALDATPDGTVDVIVAKNRKGARDTVKLDYIKKYSAFIDPAHQGTGLERVA